MPEPHPTTSVIICAYTYDRWTDLCAAVDSVRKQTRRPVETIVVIDNNPILLETAQRHLTDITIISNSGSRGLSNARNSGVSKASGEIIAFLDDDAVAAPDWLESLIAPFEISNVFAVGGTVEPAWVKRSPSWLPAEFLWVVGCSYVGLPDTQAPVRNVIGANMAFRRRVFESAGLFRDGMGRVGTLPLGCEETELCIRARQRWPDQQVIFEPAAKVTHKVPEFRATLRYFRHRCFAEGRSKAAVSRIAGASDGLASERTYTFSTLPKGALKGVSDLFRGDPIGISRSLAICFGLGVTTLGYMVGIMSTRTEPARMQPVKATD